MSILSIGGCAFSLGSMLLSGISRAASRGHESEANRAGASGAGKFSGAINDALGQLGVLAGSAGNIDNSAVGSVQGSRAKSGGAGSTAADAGVAAPDAQLALSTFTQNLLAALQAQRSQRNTAAAAGPDAAAVGAVDAGSSVSPAAGHAQHAGASKLDNDLPRLLQQLASASAATAASGPHGIGSAGAASTPEAAPASASRIDALQKSFSNLLAADGASASTVSLSGFLQTLSANMQGAPATGNVVKTKA